MHLILCSIFVICIAAIQAQYPDHPTLAVVLSDTVTQTSDDTTAIEIDSKDQDHSSEQHDGKKKNFDHEHQSHHEHDATISVDVHNIIDLFKEQLHASEQRILAAFSSHGAILKSYRTADR
ncbi:unnamed protein product [Rotaria socialis]|uniref:Uncharacterized protein n=1 Tax=Rotaria socialis TaxID=392032 RepID=A0A820XHS1_9BILA|nr:unnamed protein product [Rotaria socialis]CAF3364574.1 unnamed protein product [Rotaria socialis]CAF4533419.1 unnamed protein product [Rotaria socialis]